MAITAQIISDDRGFQRFATGLDATLRDRVTRPYDVTIGDLSLTGFRLSGGPKLEVGAQASIGFAGIGVQQARVMRQDGSGYGCEFITPITKDMLTAALTVGSVAPIAFPAPSLTILDQTPEPHVELYTPRIKLAVVALATVFSWAVAAGMYIALS